MARKILILNGSPKKNGNTSILSGWFAEGARSGGARVEAVRASSLKNVEKMFRIIADYSEMKFMSLLVPDARESGDILKLKGIRGKAAAPGKRSA